MQDKSPRLWGFLLAVYLVSFVTYYLLWKAYNHVSALRANALMSPEVKPEQYAVIVRDIPPVPEGQTRKEQVDTYFKTIYPDTFYRSMVVTDNKVVCCSIFLTFCALIVTGCILVFLFFFNAVLNSLSFVFPFGTFIWFCSV